MYLGVAARQAQELVDVLMFCWSPVCKMQFRNEDLQFLGQSLDSSLETFNCNDLYVLSLILALPGRCCMPRRKSVGCVGTEENSFLWSGSFCHRFHRVGRQFMVSCRFGYFHCWYCSAVLVYLF